MHQKYELTIFIKNVRDIKMVMQRVSFSPESGGVWKPKMTMLWKIFVLAYNP